MQVCKVFYASGGTHHGTDAVLVHLKIIIAGARFLRTQKAYDMYGGLLRTVKNMYGWLDGQLQLWRDREKQG